MSTTDEQIKAAEQQGREACLAGQPYSSSPYKRHQGSPTRVLAIAWGRGFTAAEGEQAEGQHFKTGR